MKIYQGIQANHGCGGQVVTVTENGQSRVLSPLPSQEVHNHSPDGFNWGYGGSGPAQTALAILLDVTGDPEKSHFHHQQFKWDFVCKWGPQWRISDGEIETWLSKQREPV